MWSCLTGRTAQHTANVSVRPHSHLLKWCKRRWARAPGAQRKQLAPDEGVASLEHPLLHRRHRGFDLVHPSRQRTRLLRCPAAALAVPARRRVAAGGHAAVGAELQGWQPASVGHPLVLGDLSAGPSRIGAQSNLAALLHSSGRCLRGLLRRGRSPAPHVHVGWPRTATHSNVAGQTLSPPHAHMQAWTLAMQIFPMHTSTHRHTLRCEHSPPAPAQAACQGLCPAAPPAASAAQGWRPACRATAPGSRGSARTAAARCRP